jgi:hypothetical protein
VTSTLSSYAISSCTELGLRHSLLDANYRVSNRNLCAHLFYVTISYSRVLVAIELSGDVHVQVFHTRAGVSTVSRGQENRTSSGQNPP